MHREAKLGAHVMNKVWLILVSISCIFIDKVLADSDFDNYAQGTDIFIPNEKEQRALNSLKSTNARSPSGVSSRPGEVVFNFGEGHHSVVCAVLELCDIALEPGEKILGAQIGDSSRWSVDSALSGSGKNLTEHIIIKPYESNLKTSLMVTTDRRAYHLSLRSSLNDYMPLVRFMYPDDRFSAFTSTRLPLTSASNRKNTAITYQENNDVEQIDEQRALTKSASASRSEDFEISGDEEICPSSVVFDGKRTIITMKTGSLTMPVLMLQHPDDPEKEVSANYRLAGNSYIVDGLVRKALLRTSPSDGGMECEITFLG